MGKRGFTLIELLAVIIMLGLILAIAVPSISGITKVIQNSMLEKKLDFVKEAAILYGEDNLETINSSSLKYNGNNCITIMVKDLVPDYLDKDNENECNDSSLGCIVDPSDSSHYLDDIEVIIYYQNRRVKAINNLDNSLSCS